MKKSELLRAMKRASGKRRCLAARIFPGTCSHGFGRAHSVSARRALEPIARNGHVYRLRSDGVARRPGATIAVEPAGVRKASTFYGFCSEHDLQIFRAIDEASFPASKIEGALLLYRAVVHELVKKQWVLDLLSDMAQTKSSEVLEALRAGTSWSVLALFEHLERLEQVLLSEQFQDVCVEVFESDEPANVVSSGIWFPDFDFDGTPLQEIPTLEHVPALLGIFALPKDNGSSISFVWHRESAWCVQRLLHSLARGALERIGARVFQAILTTSENIFFRPEWWDGLAEETREAVLMFWNRQTDMRVAVDPGYLGALAATDLEWSVSGIRSERRAG